MFKVVNGHLLGGSQNRQCLTIVTKNKQYKANKKQYIKQYLKSKQTILKDSTRRYERVSTRIA
jgi:hypothetical protein